MDARASTDPGVAACLAAVQRAVAGLPAGACTVETEEIAPAGTRNLRARPMLGVTITPASAGAAALFLILDTHTATVLTGTGDLRNRIELLAKRRPGSTDPTYDEELGAIVEAVVAGRIEDEVALGRSGRKLRRTTSIERGDGSVLRERNVRWPFAHAAQLQRTTYAPYA